MWVFPHLKRHYFESPGLKFYNINMCWHPEQATTSVLSKKIVSFVCTLIFMKIKDVILMAVVPERKLGADAGFLEGGPYV